MDLDSRGAEVDVTVTVSHLVTATVIVLTPVNTPGTAVRRLEAVTLSVPN
jgi:hypothetical protein